MLASRDVEDIGLAAILTGVGPEVNLRECITCIRPPSADKALSLMIDSCGKYFTRWVLTFSDIDEWSPVERSKLSCSSKCKVIQYIEMNQMLTHSIVMTISHEYTVFVHMGKCIESWLNAAIQ